MSDVSLFLLVSFVQLFLLSTLGLVWLGIRAERKKQRLLFQEAISTARTSMMVRGRR